MERKEKKNGCNRTKEMGMNGVRRSLCNIAKMESMFECSLFVWPSKTKGKWKKWEHEQKIEKKRKKKK